MTKNPLINASASLGYIILIALLMQLVSKVAPKQDSILAPVAALSLFTLSAAIMGYLFCSEPLLLFLDGKKKQAVTLFLQTVLVFGGLTLIVFLLAISGIFPPMR